MTNKITIKIILQEMKNVVEAQQIKSPGWWLDQAINLTALWQDLKDELTKAEIDYLRVVNVIEEDQDCSHAKAVTEAKSVKPLNDLPINEYQMFKYLEGRDKIVKEFIMLAKKRSKTEEYLFD